MLVFLELLCLFIYSAYRLQASLQAGLHEICVSVIDRKIPFSGDNLLSPYIEFGLKVAASDFALAHEERIKPCLSSAFITSQYPWTATVR
ncbi:MAG: hypothetical protein ACRESV_07155, partial [Nevskiales bacterium]